MSIQFQKIALGVLSAALLAGTAGCGSDSKGGSSGEAGRIAASLQERQAELSTESLDGLWFAYEESSYKDYYEDSEEYYSYKGKVISRSYVTVREENGVAVPVFCDDGFFVIDLESGLPVSDLPGLELDLEISDNMQMELAMSRSVDYQEDGERASWSYKGKISLFKISDSAELPIGEVVVGEDASDVSCARYRKDSWSGEEVYEGEEWSGKGVDTHFNVQGDNDISLTKWEEDGEVDYVLRMDEARANSWSDGASFSLDILSPLLYNFTFTMGDSEPEIDGEVAIF